VIALLLDAIPAPVWAALVGMVAIAAAWLTGRRDGAQRTKTKAAEKAAESYRATSEAMHNADTGSGDDDDNVKWLRDRSKR
jgi:hypothetical protein